MKNAKACLQCRAAKRKRRLLSGKNTCFACQQRGEPCSSTELSKASITTQLAPLERVRTTISPITNIDDLLSPQIQWELVTKYMAFIHDRPQSIFHEPTLRDQVQQREIHPGLLLAICSLACRFSHDPAVRALEDCLTRASKMRLQANLEQFCLATIQTCILVANASSANLNPESEALYFGIAIRMAQIMRLPHGKRSENPAVTETRKRDNDYAVDLPIDESTFQQPEFRLRGSTGSTLGIWAYKIMLAKIFGHIQDLNRCNVVRGLCQQDFDGHVKLLAEQLDDWVLNLPSHMQLSDRNIREHCSKGLGGTFIDLHLDLHHYATLLFFNYLESRRLYSSNKLHYSQLCKSHAFRFSELLQISRERKGCEAVHAAVGHMAIVSSAVLVHVLLMGEVGELEAARSGLISNFKTLLELKMFWPSLEKLISRLSLFQSALIESLETDPRKMDGWMARFLTEYAPPSDDFIDSDPTPPISISLTRQGTVSDKDGFWHRNNTLTELLNGLR
ncbi:hypothetical protein NOF04DRAFT_1371435 [Fusarium oxysporum II5]|nr:hypothetical protein NOF04DRAFT_1371435 [Fusarium oxysporum II5]